jgi:uncharacterized protein
MTQLQIGSYVNGGFARLQLESFLETRGLIQANSGGGKSYLIRRAVEVLAGKVQQIVIDTEGEFATLREKFDFVVVSAAGGDAIAHPRTAALLARRLLETRVSAILDISELKARQRDEFVCNFLVALMDLPRSLWGELLVVLDEAHAYCPEKGQGEALSTDAVIDLASRGRKRGFALLAATQRSSKFHKSAAAELLNKFVGRTGLDVDVKRAAFDLGMTPKDAQAALVNLGAGEFFAYGPAVSKTVQLMKVDEVETTHPKSGHRGGKRAIILPKPTDAIRAVLPQLADLQAEQEQKAKTEEDLRREAAALQQELKLAQRAIAERPSTHSAADIVEARRTGERSGYDRGREEGYNAAISAHSKYVDQVEAWRSKFPRADETARLPVPPASRAPAARQVITSRSGPILPTVPAAPARRSTPTTDLPKGEAAVLAALIQYPNGLRREQLTILTAYKRSSRDAYIQRLRERGFVDTTGDRVTATQVGIDALPDAEPLPTGIELQGFWLQRLPEGERKILQVLIDANGEPVDRDSLEAETGYKRSSRDAYLQRLRAKELIDEPMRGSVAAAAQLFA